MQTVCRLTAQPVPVTVTGSTDVTISQMFALANEEGADLAASHDWQILRKQWELSTTGTTEQPGWLPDDIDHFIFNTSFDRTTQRRVIGPITPQMWQAIQAQPQLNRVFLAWIQRGGKILVTPTPSVGDDVAYEYITVNWCAAQDGTPQDQYILDTDTAVIDERLIRLGVRWRYLSAKGLDYSEAFRTYEYQKQIVQARDGGNTVLNAGGYTIFDYSNVPIGSFPGYPVG